MTMTLKDSSAKQILIAAIITILLQSGIVAGIAIHGVRIAQTERTVEFINENYIPTWFLEGMIDNMNYQTQEIVATMNGDAAKIREINEKYVVFQKTMLKNLIQMRGGVSGTVRSASPIKAIEESMYK